MGGFLSKPITEKFVSEGGDGEVQYGVAAMQGWRVDMEDAHLATEDDNHIKYYGVFDGHAGSLVAKESAEKLLSYLSLKVSDDDDTIKGKMKDAFLKLDEHLRTNVKESSGSTAVVCAITPTKIIFSNCGDSRGILCRNGVVKFHTEDHKPSDEGERKRIELAGGSVMMQRVNGSLGVSRALGDFSYKNNTEVNPIQQMVSPEPETTVFERESGDQFVVLACDGIYDVVNNDEVVNFVSDELKRTPKLHNICGQLMDICLAKNSRDNMTVILISLPGAPKFSEEAEKKKDEILSEMREEIKAIVKEVVREANDPGDCNSAILMSSLMTKLEHHGILCYLLCTFLEDELDRQCKEKFGNDPSLSVEDSSFSMDESDASKAPATLDGLMNVLRFSNEQQTAVSEPSAPGLPSFNPDEISMQGSDRPTPPEGAADNP